MNYMSQKCIRVLTIYNFAVGEFYEFLGRQFV